MPDVAAATGTGDRAGGGGSAQTGPQQDDLLDVEEGLSTPMPELAAQRLQYYQDHADKILKRVERMAGMSGTRRPAGMFADMIR